MRLRSVFLILLLTPAFATASHAGGSFSVQTDVQQNGILFRDVGIMLNDQIYMVGVYSPGIFTEQRAWFGRNSGRVIDTAISVAFTRFCDFAHMFGTLESVSWLDPLTGAAGGGSVPESCTILFPFPYCEACLLLYEPTVWRLKNNGTTLDHAISRGAIFGSIFKVEYLTRDAILAVGSAGTMLLSSVGTEQWEVVYGPAGDYGVYTDVEFIDADLGYTVLNVPSDDRLSGRLPESAPEALDRIAYLRHAQSWLTDPTYRMKDPPMGPPVRVQTAYCYKTANRFGTWLGPVFQKSGVNFLLTSWYSEKYGFVVSDEAAGDHGAQFSIYYTHDGGDSWETGSLPAAGPGADGAYDIADIKYLTSAIGYAVGAAKVSGSTFIGFILKTSDGGATWTFDSITPGAALSAMEFKNRTLGYLVGNKSFIGKYTGVNQPPVANAGPDQTVGEDDEVYLDGSASFDPDDFIDTWLWEQIAGAPVDLTWEDTSTPGFLAGSNPDVLTFKLTVTAGGDSSSDTVNIKIVAIDDDSDDDATDDSDDDAADDSDDDDWHDDDADDDALDDADDDDQGDDIPSGDDDDLSTHGPLEGDSGCCG